MADWLVPQLEPWITDREKELVMECLDAAWITEGPKAARFLDVLQGWIGFQYGALAPNGTLGLYLGLLALNLEPGSEIIIPDITFYASASAAVLAGLKPVFCDVKPGTYQIDVKSAEQHLTDRTVAIMPVHLFGGSCDMTAVMDFAATCGLLVIEDAAQALGVTHNGRHCGTQGAIGMISFFADKTITTGEGGLIMCKDQAVYERLQLMRNQGRAKRGSFYHEAMGWNFRMTDLQAAVGLAQMERFERIVFEKRQHLQRYRERLEALDIMFLEYERGTTKAVPFRAVIFAQEAKRLMAHLVDKRIQPRGFFQPMHRQPFFSRGLGDSDYPISAFGAEHGICLPVYPTLKDAQIDYVCETIRSYYGKG